MAWRPPNLAGEPISTTTESSDRIREKECLSDRDHFGLKALLRRLIPESHYGERWPEERQADRGPLAVRAARAALLRPSSTLEGSPGFYVPPSDWTPVRS